MLFQKPRKAFRLIGLELSQGARHIAQPTIRIAYGGMRQVRLAYRPGSSSTSRPIRPFDPSEIPLKHMSKDLNLVMARRCGHPLDTAPGEGYARVLHRECCVKWRPRSISDYGVCCGPRRLSGHRCCFQCVLTLRTREQHLDGPQTGRQAA